MHKYLIVRPSIINISDLIIKYKSHILQDLIPASHAPSVHCHAYPDAGPLPYQSDTRWGYTDINGEWWLPVLSDNEEALCVVLPVMRYGMCLAGALIPTGPHSVALTATVAQSYSCNQGLTGSCCFQGGSENLVIAFVVFNTKFQI